MAGAVLSFVGLTHADQVGWNEGGKVALDELFWASPATVRFGIAAGYGCPPAGES